MTQDQFFARYKYDPDTDFLGGGGFGKVFKAFDDTLNKHVALKVAEVKIGQESLSLMKEVELASSLPKHKNIAHYEDCYRYKLHYGTFDYGIIQYYPDGNLSQLIRQKKLTPTQKEEIAKGIVAGLDHLHSHNVIHRDLKSANILIAKGYQGEYVPKIADFGLSKQLSDSDKSYFSNSFAGGSLLYVAPEQLEGKELRKNVDLWSLGVVLYELFVGETPFKANVDDGSETARAEIISKIKNADIPSAISSIPVNWQKVIRGCLVTDPTRRIKSIQASMKSKSLSIDTKVDIEIETILHKPKVPKVINTESTTIPKWMYLLISGIAISLVVIYGLRSNVSNDYTSPKKQEQASIEKPIIKMISIPGSNFKLSETEVTIGQYLAFCQATKSHWPEWLENGIVPSPYIANDDLYGRVGMSVNNTNHPITGVSAYSADAFCKWMGGRLPTESEWEYAAKGGFSYKYAGSNTLDEVGWYVRNSTGTVKRVKQKRPNDYGLYDMSGNVCEWTSSEEGGYRVIRGGSWFNDTSLCRISSRNKYAPYFRSFNFGFRLATSQN